MDIALIEAIRKKTVECQALGDEYLDVLFNQDRTSIYYRFLYFLIKECAATLSVELGVCTGRGTAHMAAANPNGKVIGVDPAAWGTLAGIMKRYPNIELQRCRSDSPQLLDSISVSSVEVLFIDSVHISDYTLEETQLWTPKMKDGGVILYDDLLHSEDMRTLLPQLPFPEKGFLDGLHFSGFGYAIVRR